MFCTVGRSTARPVDDSFISDVAVFNVLIALSSRSGTDIALLLADATRSHFSSLFLMGFAFWSGFLARSCLRDPA